MFRRKIQTKDIRSTYPDDNKTLEEILSSHNHRFDELEEEISAIKDTSIKVGDKVMLRKDFTKVYEVESIVNGKLIDSPQGTPFRLALMIEENWDKVEIKYALDNNKVYTQDQILPYREDSHLLAKEIKKLK